MSTARIENIHPSAPPDHPLGHCTAFDVAGTQLVSVHTPGHSHGSASLYACGLTTVFTGDTLLCGGPGATGRSHSDEPTILRSIRPRLVTLPGDTVVRTGHGADTTIVAEVCHVG
jgi:glyoxylase-like metal-dependent hydrolase (beta-lactamase superfamily II)